MLPSSSRRPGAAQRAEYTVGALTAYARGRRLVWVITFRLARVPRRTFPSLAQPLHEVEVGGVAGVAVDVGGAVRGHQEGARAGGGAGHREGTPELAAAGGDVEAKDA